MNKNAYSAIEWKARRNVRMGRKMEIILFGGVLLIIFVAVFIAVISAVVVGVAASGEDGGN